MVNYQNGKIYKIYSYQTDDVYYGSTTQILCKRMATHRAEEKRGKGASSSKEILKFDDAMIELVESFPCDGKEELHKREGWYIKNNDCVNKRIAGRTGKEYREDNKVAIKQWREDNKDKIAEHNKQWREDNKDKIAERCKQRYQDDKVKFTERNKQWRENNKVKIAERKKIKTVCVCGSECRADDKARHQRSKKHQAFINQ